MSEHSVTLHCEPCACPVEASQHIVDGRLHWEESQQCAESGAVWCDGDRGPAPRRVRERIVAHEGTVRLGVGGPDGVPLKAVRELYRLSLAELRHARAHGIEATPVEARLLSAVSGTGGPG